MDYNAFRELLLYFIGNESKLFAEMSSLEFDMDEVVCELYSYYNGKEYNVDDNDIVIQWFANSLESVVDDYYTDLMCDFDEFISDVLIGVTLLYVDYSKSHEV